MASVNKVILVGNIGQDASLRKMNSGDAVVNLSLATTETWKDRSSGQKKEHTEWHRITFYRKLATLAAQYLKKVPRSTSRGACRRANSPHKMASSDTAPK